MSNKSNMSNITQKWVDLLVPFTRNYATKLSASELARETKIPQQTASRYLEKLVSQSILQYKRQGKNKLYYFDLEKQTTKIILNIVESQKSLKFEISVDKSILINEILQHCESLIIFGSYAKGNFHEKSDLDLAILGKTDKEEIKKIKRRQIIEINEQYIDYSQILKLLKNRNTLSLEILKDHLLFGNITKIVEIFLEISS